jgi:hypothetical protein
MTTDSPFHALAALLGPDTLVHEGEIAARAHTGWLVQPLGHAAHVLHHGETVAVVDLEDFTVRLTIGARYEGSEPTHPIAEAQGILEEQMWPAWAARGYAIDRTCSPDNGWDADAELWIRNVRRTLSGLAEVAAELAWIKTQERTHNWG